MRLLLIHRTIECLHRIRQSFEAHVDGHSAFNGGVAGSRPAGGTKWVSHLDGQVGKCILPRWCNGSVFVLHAKGGGSIPSRGTKRDIQPRWRPSL